METPVEISTAGSHSAPCALPPLATPLVSYDPEAIAAHFDQLGAKEWDRFDRTLGDRVSLARHVRYLERFLSRGSRVLEVGAGVGRFTEHLHRFGARIVVSDLSAEQLRLNEAAAHERGFAASVERWERRDICDLTAHADASFDALVAYGGPLSYVFGERDRALAECGRVLRPGGLLFASVMSLWGTMHRHLASVQVLPRENTDRIIISGDLTKETDPTSTHHCHMYQSGDLRAFVERGRFEVVVLAASSALTTGHPAEFETSPALWEALLEWEELACGAPGYLDAGTHLIVVARWPG